MSKPRRPGVVTSPLLPDRRLEAALGEASLKVEHIGPTAVPRLAAKSIVDMLLVVADSSGGDPYAPSMRQCGYELRVREPEFAERWRRRSGIGANAFISLSKPTTGSIPSRAARATRSSAQPTNSGAAGPAGRGSAPGPAGDVGPVRGAFPPGGSGRCHVVTMRAGGGSSISESTDSYDTRSLSSMRCSTPHRSSTKARARPTSSKSYWIRSMGFDSSRGTTT